MSRSIVFMLLVVFSTAFLFCNSAGQDQDAGNDQLIVMAKDLVNSLSQKDFSGAVKDFNSKMKKALPVSKVQEAWDSVIARNGPFKRRLAVRTGKIASYDVVYVTCEYEKANLDTKVVFGKDKQIAGLFFVIPGQR